MAEPTYDEDLLWSDDLLRSLRQSAFRLETRAVYALTYCSAPSRSTAPTAPS
jgi:hypothetical protein